MCRVMHSGQALFSLGIEPDIPRIHPWNELLATGAQTTWLTKYMHFDNNNQMSILK